MPTILVADRDKHVGNLLAHFLGGAGYTVVRSGDGASALKAVRESRPDVVITDVLLPGMDGLELCRAIKGNPDTSDTAVIVFSSVFAMLRARQAGADVFLPKPLNARRMLDVVARFSIVPATEAAV